MGTLLEFTTQSIQALQTDLAEVEAEIVAQSQVVAQKESSASSWKTGQLQNRKDSYNAAAVKSAGGGGNICGVGYPFPVSMCGDAAFWLAKKHVWGASWNEAIVILNTKNAAVTSAKNDLKILTDKKSAIQAQINDLLATQAAQTQAEIDSAKAEALSDPTVVAAGIEAQKEVTKLELENERKSRNAIILAVVVIVIVLGSVFAFVRLRG